MVSTSLRRSRHILSSSTAHGKNYFPTLVQSSASKLYQNTCRILGISNILTSAYQPQTNGQLERLNRSIALVLRFYVSDHPENRDKYIDPLTHALNLNVNSGTVNSSADLVLACRLPECTLHYDKAAPSETDKDSTDFAEQLQKAIPKAIASLDKAQQHYKTDFDKRLRKSQDRPTVGGWIFLDPPDAESKPTHDADK